MRALYFTVRNMKEILRDPLSYIFCLGFPVAMLLMFVVINHYSGGNTYWFELANLAPALTVFSFSFVLLFMTLLVAKDRATAFINRLFISPMTGFDFVAGYALCGLLLGLCQALVGYLAAPIIALCSGTQLSFWQLLRTLPFLLPVLLFFTCLGILFGSMFSEKSGPGIASVIITASGLTGGVWMPLETMGGFEKICRCLPFYPSVILSRRAYYFNELSFNNFGIYLIICICWALFMLLSTVWLLQKTLKQP